MEDTLFDRTLGMVTKRATALHRRQKDVDEVTGRVRDLTDENLKLTENRAIKVLSALSKLAMEAPKNVPKNLLQIGKHISTNKGLYMESDGNLYRKYWGSRSYDGSLHSNLIWNHQEPNNLELLQTDDINTVADISLLLGRINIDERQQDGVLASGLIMLDQLEGRNAALKE